MLDDTNHTIELDGYQVEMNDAVKQIVNHLVRIRNLGEQEAVEAGLTPAKFRELCREFFSATRAAINEQYDPDTAEYLSTILSRQISCDLAGFLSNCINGPFPLDPFESKNE